MAFLDKLRLTNVMRQRPDEERPWGMPELFDSSPQEPVIGHGITQGPPVQRPQRINPRIASNQKMNVVYGGQEGFTPTQNRFRQDDLRKQEMDFRKQQLTDNFMRQQEMDRQRRDDREFMFNKELGGKKELEDLGFNRTAKLREIDKKAQAERDVALAKQRTEDIVTRARVQGEEARRTAKEKPIADKPLDDARDLNNRMQQLVLQHPQITPFIKKNPETGMMEISEDASPEQAKWIQGQLGSTGQKPTGKTGVMRRRNKKNPNIVQESTDGGKTWKEVK